MRKVLLGTMLWIAGSSHIVLAQDVTVRTLNKKVIDSRVDVAPEKNKDRQLQLKAFLEQAGCPSAYLEEQSIRGRKLPNVVCTLPGDTELEIVVGAHYDFDPDFGGGVVDNWSGAALLPSLLESLCTQRRRHTFRFIGFEGEEAGLVGSKHYVKQLSREDRRRVKAMVNMDCLGLGTPNVDTHSSDDRLVKLLARVANTLHVPLEGVDTHRVGMSDSDSFVSARIPVLLIHSITQENLSTIHSRKDRPDSLRRQEYYDTYRLVSLFLGYLDMVLED